ncbi:hypothetical protein BDV25DRAFT_143898 [Aspergillus avenaceus]|uniref:Uncharacterized protein n=1 Tax=Aspergillus avenaceus TaxID=36643 RepID=A0A5N6TIR4_ASPAV|nr:hypothetical protein BDV25DRAFT_143898 [Aspergillus avenaceus]
MDRTRALVQSFGDILRRLTYRETCTGPSLGPQLAPKGRKRERSDSEGVASKRTVSSNISNSEVEQLSAGKELENSPPVTSILDVKDEDEAKDAVLETLWNEKPSGIFDFSAERARRWASAVDLPEGLYNKAEQDIFFRLAMRGFEPIIPRRWRHDFPTLPSTLFADQNDDEPEPLIRALKPTQTYAIKSLSNLFSLGGRVRDHRILGLSPEILIKKAIEKYINWALNDVNLHMESETPQLHLVRTLDEGETTLTAVTRLNQRLQSMAIQYNKVMGMTVIGNDHSSADSRIKEEDHVLTENQDPRVYPLLIGFLICGHMVTILTLGTDPSSTTNGADSKFMFNFDLEESGQDVWNSLAIAIIVMKVRDTMLQLAKKGICGFGQDSQCESVLDEDV